MGSFNTPGTSVVWTELPKHEYTGVQPTLSCPVCLWSGCIQNNSGGAPPAARHENCLLVSVCALWCVCVCVLLHACMHAIANMPKFSVPLHSGSALLHRATNMTVIFHSLTPTTTASASAPDCLQWLPENQAPGLLVCPSCYKSLMTLCVSNMCALYCDGFHL